MPATPTESDPATPIQITQQTNAIPEKQLAMNQDMTTQPDPIDVDFSTSKPPPFPLTVLPPHSPSFQSSSSCSSTANSRRATADAEFSSCYTGFDSARLSSPHYSNYPNHSRSSSQQLTHSSYPSYWRSSSTTDLQTCINHRPEMNCAQSARSSTSSLNHKRKQLAAPPYPDDSSRMQDDLHIPISADNSTHTPSHSSRSGGSSPGAGEQGMSRSVQSSPSSQPRKRLLHNGSAQPALHAQCNELEQQHSNVPSVAMPMPIAPPPIHVTAQAPIQMCDHTSPKRLALLSVLSCVLEQLFSNPHDTLPADATMLTRFHTERIPAISIGRYLERVAHYSECSEEALIMAFIHISRISHNKPSFHLNALSIHRLLLASIMTSVKFFDDHYYNNNHFAKVGGVQIHEMNTLELEFLALIEFQLFIDDAIFRRFRDELTQATLHLHPACCQWQTLKRLLVTDESDDRLHQHPCA